MSWLPPFVIAALSSCSVLFLVYLYLFLLDRKPYLAYWAVSWGLNSLRYTLILAGLLQDEFPFLLIVNQLVSPLSALSLLGGTYSFLEKPLPKSWRYPFILYAIWTSIGLLLGTSFSLFFLTTTTLAGALYIWIGVILLQSRGNKGFPTEFTAWCSIIWGVLEADYDFFPTGVWFLTYRYLMTSVVELLAAFGFLLIHFQRGREELLDIQKTLVKSEEKFRNLFHHANDPIFLNELTPDGRRGQFIEVNETASRRLGYSREELLTMLPGDFEAPEDANKTSEPLQTLLSTGHVTFETAYLTKGGLKIPVEINSHLFFLDGKKVVLSVARDITERKRAEEQIKYLSFHDKLTGLYNRAYFEEELKRLDTERQLPISLIMGDINGLKLANDAFGHEAGDMLLKNIAGILTKSCRKGDIIARWGGDEFILLLPKTSERTALEICERIRKACREAPPNPIEPSIALGTSTKETAGQNIQEILKEAEDKMYRNKLTENTSIRSSIITSLAKTLWEKDYQTEEHVQRLQKLAMKLGRALELSDSQLDELSLLATLHDIGKIGIPDEILTKPEELSQDEWKIMHKHSEIGYRIAESSIQLSPIAYTILSHHERWDGKGYPRGLKGEEIPLLSRILAIIDAYDVMTHDRPYHTAMSPEEALEELKREAGAQFDPKLVEIFVQLMREEIVQERSERLTSSP